MVCCFIVELLEKPTSICKKDKHECCHVFLTSYQQDFFIRPRSSPFPGREWVWLNIAILMVHSAYHITKKKED